MKKVYVAYGKSYKLLAPLNHSSRIGDIITVTEVLTIGFTYFCERSGARGYNPAGSIAAEEVEYTRPEMAFQEGAVDGN